MSIVDIVEHYITLPLRETAGKNRSTEIDLMNSFVGAAMGSPYCAAGLSYCFHRNDPKTPFPKTASSQAIKRWFDERGWLSNDPQHLLGWSGALFGWTNPDKAHGHVGLMVQRKTIVAPNGKPVITKMGTMEFNTSSKTKSRDGDGAFALERGVREREFWYCNLSHLEGGRYW